MTPLWFPGLLIALLLLLLTSCQAESSEDGPILTRLTEPKVHGEGPHWDSTDNVLYYVDISGRKLCRYDPATDTEKTISFNKPVALVVPIKEQKYKFVLGLGLDLVVLTWDWDSGFNSTSPIVSVDQDKPGNRFNDGKADAKGRIWAGTMGLEDSNGVAPEKASLYRVNNDPSVSCRAETAVTPVTISNGLAWTEDNQILYYIDTPTRRVDAFDFDLSTGEIYNRRTVFEFGSTSGNPDGMTIDSDGNLWIACWGGSQVIQVNPITGQLTRQIKLPVSLVTSVVFGGEKLDTLYVTTMRLHLNSTELQKQPTAGSMFKVTNLKVTGTPSKPAIVNCKCNL